MKTVFFFRRANAAWHHSIEELFDTIIPALPQTVQPERYVMKNNSIGFWKRLLNALDAPFHQGDVNHITGDVHYIAAFLKKRKTILTIHDLRILSSGGGLRLAVLKFFWFTMPGHRVRFVTVISEFIRDELIRTTRIKPDKILVVHDCISAAICPAPKPFPGSRPVVLQIGTTPNKNLERVAEAISSLDVHMVIIGKLNDNQVRHLNHHRISYEYHFNLPYTEVLNQYRNADIVMFASLYEGFGLPILEANAIGRPVIAGNNTSLPEVAGEAAFLVDAGNTLEIREALLRLINEPELREHLISKGFENVKRFQPHTIGKKYAAIYEQIANH